MMCCVFAVVAGSVALEPLDMRWTFGAHEPYAMYRRVGRRCTGGIDGNARWLRPWLNWWDEEAPRVMKELGLNWVHSRFYKGMGWEAERKDFPNVKTFVRNCHANGVHVLAYVQFSTLYPDIMRAEVPGVDSWQQIDANGKVELCAFNGQDWIRLSGTLVEDPRIEAKKAMLDAYPNLRSMYDENDDNTAVYFFTDATADICSFTKEKETIKF